MKHGYVQNLMTRMLQGSTAALCLLIFAIASTPAKAEVYKWTDENGVTHFSQTPPPPGQDAEIQDLPEHQAGVESDPSTANTLNDTANEELSAADLRRQELADARRERADAEAANDTLCMDTQERLAQLEPSRRVFYTNEDTSGQIVIHLDEMPH